MKAIQKRIVIFSICVVVLHENYKIFLFPKRIYFFKRGYLYFSFNKKIKHIILLFHLNKKPIITALVNVFFFVSDINTKNLFFKFFS